MMLLKAVQEFVKNQSGTIHKSPTLSRQVTTKYGVVWKGVRNYVTGFVAVPQVFGETDIVGDSQDMATY